MLCSSLKSTKSVVYFTAPAVNIGLYYFIFLVVPPPKTWKWMLLCPWREDKAICRGHCAYLVCRRNCHEHGQPWCELWMPLESGASHGLFYSCLMCLFTFQWVFISSSLMDGLILPKVLGFAEEQAGSTRCVRHHPAGTGGWWMMGCGWYYSRHPQMCHMNGCNGFVGLKENKITVFSLVGQKAQNSWFSLLKSWLWVHSIGILSW